MFSGFVETGELVERLSHAEVGDGIIGLVVQGLPVTVERGAVILLLEIKVADLNVLQGPVWVEGMKFPDAAGSILIGNLRGKGAVGMVLGIVFGWAEVNAGVAAGTLSGFLAALGAGRRLVLI